MSNTARDTVRTEQNFTMRRAPQQTRSRSTIEFIKQAALQIIEGDGIGACRTEVIAERAGVSIGSLYKYFPNRESILKALYEDASMAYAQTVGKLMLRILHLPTERGMALTLRNIVPLHRHNRLVLLRLAEEMPELHLQDQPLSFHNLVRSNIRAYIQHRNPELSSSELQSRMFFVERLVFSSIDGYLRSASPAMSPTRFTNDLSMLVTTIIDRPVVKRTRKSADRRSD